MNRRILRRGWQLQAIHIHLASCYSSVIKVAKLSITGGFSGTRRASQRRNYCMDNKETHAFAERLMRQVWEPLDSLDVPQFYHQDVVGHHRAQEIGYEDIVNRLDWDRQT